MQATFRPIETELTQIEALIEKRDLSEAASALNLLRDSAGDDPRVYSLGAELAFAARNPGAALKSADVALGMAPNAPRVHFQRARALEALGRLDESLAACEAAVIAGPRMLGAVELAIYVGRRLGNHTVPETLLRTAQRTDPENAAIWLAMGKFLALKKQPEALEWFARVLEETPQNLEALLVSAALRFDLDDKEHAREQILRAYSLDSADERVAFERARICGDGVAQIPRTQIRALFDEYAERYDSESLGVMKYVVPRLVADKVRESYPELKINLLDLGCGTGLLGLYLGRIEGYFVGVDLSEKMLQQAASRDIYSRLHLVEMVEALGATDASEYEVIAACDALVYLADPTAFVNQSHRVLRTGGTLYFSCEQAEENEATSVLRASKRYAHRADWVESLCRSAGFQNVTLEPIMLREDQGKPVNGFLVTAVKATG